MNQGAESHHSHSDQGSGAYASLHNLYYAMRHGQSEANVRGIIVSDPTVGIDDFGLTAEGKRQIESSVLRCRDSEHDVIDRHCIILSSDFARAAQSAEIAHHLLSCDTPLRFHRALRERHFGDLDMQSADHYEAVWRHDAADPDHTNWQVESVTHVAQRTQRLIAALESDYVDRIVLLVAHGDVLQILQTHLMDMPLTAHRRLDHLHNGEIRLLNPKQ